MSSERKQIPTVIKVAIGAIAFSAGLSGFPKTHDKTSSMPQIEAQTVSQMPTDPCERPSLLDPCRPDQKGVYRPISQILAQQKGKQ